jgi:hypothetical protein
MSVIAQAKSQSPIMWWSNSLRGRFLLMSRRPRSGRVKLGEFAEESAINRPALRRGLRAGQPPWLSRGSAGSAVGSAAVRLVRAPSLARWSGLGRLQVGGKGAVGLACYLPGGFQECWQGGVGVVCGPGDLERELVPRDGDEPDAFHG